DLTLESASKDGRQTSDWTELRYLTARAALKGAPGVAFSPAPAPAGLTLRDFPEEAQAFGRLSREMTAAGPILAGDPAAVPFPLPAGVSARARTLRGRRYVLLLNDENAPTALAPELLVSYRALFEVRSDPRELLEPCAGRACLAARRVL